MRQASIKLSSTGTLSPLLNDYLDRKERLSPFYGFYPDKKGFGELLATQPYHDFDRKRLAEILRRQHATVSNGSEASAKHIALLEHDNCFTVTTGHQLCLFTGPLYFVYKILTTIRLAEELSAEFPEQRFVPVYWMASEDHDFEEVASFHLNGRTFTWQSSQSGAVGDFDPRELKLQLPQLRDVLGISKRADELYRLFEQSYLQHSTLSEATRFLVNALFGQYGLVILDGNDTAFKQQFVPYFKEDLLLHRPHTRVEQSASGLATMGYPVQVTPRPINCFWIEKGLRARLEKKDGRYVVVGTERSFSREELLDQLERTPERFSPNVVLRPLYQQVILPNLAYLGGPGELAYWLEFKAMFDEMQVMFPILMPRNFVTLIDQPTRLRIEQLRLNLADIYKPASELVQDFMQKQGQVIDLSTDLSEVEQQYTRLMERMKTIDPSLTTHIAAELARVRKRLSGIEDKANRALRRRSATEIHRIESLKQHVFPNGTPQERYENFAAFYLTHGPDLFDALRSLIAPFDFSMKVLMEE